MRKEQSKVFKSHDGVELFYRHWSAELTPSTQVAPAIILFHRGHEHSGRIAHLVDELNLPEYQFFAWDARGNGKSPGQRGDSPSFAWIVRDAEYFIQHIKQHYQLESEYIAVIAQSIGAVVAATWVHDYVPKIRALVLGAPAFGVKLYVPFAVPCLKLLYNLRGNFFVNSYVKSKLLTHDKNRQDSFNTDPLISRPISVRVLLDLFYTAKRIVKDAQTIHVPTQVLISGSDYVVKRKPQKQFFENLGSANKEFHQLSGFYHDILGEKDRHLAVEKARKFIIESFDKPMTIPSLFDSDKAGFMHEEAAKLASQPKSIFKKLYWESNRKLLKKVSAVSDGIKLGFETGFDSGSTLDYIYRNQASGSTGFGRFADFIYLQSIGWRGIRQRKAHIQELLTLTIEKLIEKDRRVNIVDVAAGHGRYILDTINQLQQKPNFILLRDYSDLNVKQGKALITTTGLSSIARFEKGDAFDKKQLAAISPKPTLAIVSGLYELFSDNQLVSDSLAGIAAAVEPGGYLIYTGQPWHPQLAYIARVLTSHRNQQAWVMRRRSQLEMDQLVETAGFKKITMRIDEWGIFTVSVAQRIA